MECPRPRPLVDRDLLEHGVWPAIPLLLLDAAIAIDALGEHFVAGPLRAHYHVRTEVSGVTTDKLGDIWRYAVDLRGETTLWPTERKNPSETIKEPVE